MHQLKDWFRKGTPWVWLNAGAVTISMVMVIGLLGLIAVRGMSHFWPAAILDAQYLHDGKEIRVVGEIHDAEMVPVQRLKEAGVDLVTEKAEVERFLMKTGNRETGSLDFRWVIADLMKNVEYPKDVMVLERYEWGNFYGFLQTVKEDGRIVASGEQAWPELEKRLERSTQLHEEIVGIEKGEIGAINYGLEQLRLKERSLQLNNKLDAKAIADLEADRAELNSQYEALNKKLQGLYKEVKRDSLEATISDGSTIEIGLDKVVHAYHPNSYSFLEKLGIYFARIWEFLSDDPREANTEGGIFPAIFGTVLMVMLMSVIVTPFGVIAAVYMKEYAKQGFVTRVVRIAVNNLAGVPSIVYGVFGLGFFVYFLGGSLDELFYPEAAPAPMFGTPGLMWASITLALLTLPVVIVATEEGLSRIPKSIREGSLALGATKFETLWRVILPMSSPAMMTGLILAIARAAGEVAPLMLVGVVKLAPNLPLDGNAPFLHLERKFMHLGFHIYDVGFQSPNVEAARPLVYATAFLLVLVIAALNLSAVLIRNRLRERYKSLET